MDLRDTALAVVAGGRGVGGTVALASGLDPDDRVDEGRAGARRRARAEAGALDVAPVTPCIADVLDTGATLVDDEVCREVGACEQRSKGLQRS